MPERVIDALWDQIDDRSFIRAPGGLVFDGTNEYFHRRLLSLNLIDETIGEEVMHGNVTLMAIEIQTLAIQCNVQQNLPLDWLDRARSIEPEPAIVPDNAEEGDE